MYFNVITPVCQGKYTSKFFHVLIFRRYRVVLGAHDLSEDENTQQKFKVVKYIPHPRFGDNLENDIMLLKVSDNQDMAYNNLHSDTNFIVGLKFMKNTYKIMYIIIAYIHSVYNSLNYSGHGVQSLLSWYQETYVYQENIPIPVHHSLYY